MPISSRKQFLTSFEELIQDMEECDDVDLRGSLRLANKKVRVPKPALPLQLLLGGEDGYRLHMDPEVAIAADGQFRPTGNYLLFDPMTFFNGISGFVRLTPGRSLTVGRRDMLQRLLLGFPKVVEDKHLRLKLTGNGLAMKKKAAKQSACVGPITDRNMLDRMSRWRRRKIERLAKLLGAAIERPSRGEGLDLLEQVIACMENEPYRMPTNDGRPGGLLRLPGRPAPIFVGDLHARIDNLLVILTQNGFLEALQDGSGMLILVGDAVHPDEPGMEEEMDTSMLMMDLIFRLKLLFPERVFYLRGNHDSFAEDISKGGVPQGLLWERALHENRGPRYRDSMQRLYDLLPYVAMSQQYICCHAGAPTMKVSQEDLIHVHANPALQHQLTHLRLRKPNWPSGYTRSHVARLRKRLGAPPNAAFVVGHTPLSRKESYWLNAGGIEHHHVLFGANPESVGVITRPRQHLLPLTYPVEPLLTVYNRLVHTGKTTA